MRTLAFLIFTLTACSSSAFQVAAPDDGGTSDDTGSSSDGSTVDDTATSDTGTTSDTGPADGTTSDTGGMPDTAIVPDTSVVPDTGIVDGGMCPRPASTKTYDFSMVGCDKLAAAYTEALDAAKVCACDADCGDELPDTFCMNCSVFVSRANDGYRAAKALLDEWQKRLMSGKCVPPPCPAFICPDPVFGGCHGSGPGTTSTCRVMK